MTTFWQNLFVFFRASPAVLKYGFSGRWRTDQAGNPAGEHPIGDDFFGVCVASSESPACDDYIIERLKELGLTRVRLDYTYNSRGQYAERFLRRLTAEKFKVCLHLVQPFSEAGRIQKSGQSRDDWRLFVAETLADYGHKVELIEIGSTCNRRKWSGYSLPGFLTAWKIAREVASANNCPLAGPNVTDFEPVYNIALLSEMKRKGILPAVHTDNLFVERAVEPEAYDHKIAGKRLAGLFRFNLVRKARVLNDIGLAFGVRQTICAHVSWSLRRIFRLLEDTEEKQADYLARYCCLAAASGALGRVYWGPLVGQREGLIDDGTTAFPEIPHVTFYGRAPGNISAYRIRPAYYAFQAVNRFIAGAKYIRKIQSERGLEIHEFQTADGLLHVAWTINGRRALAKDCYRGDILERAKCYSRDGVSLDRVPAMISGSPFYIIWFGEKRLSNDIEHMFAGPDKMRLLENIHFTNIAGIQYDFVARADLCGVCRPDVSGKIPGMFSALKSGGNPAFDVLRDARNRVWRVMPGGDKNAAMVVKQFRPLSPARRFFAGRKGDKALRSWNGAQELLRRGIFTPLPIAFFHGSGDPLGAESWYICDEYAGGFSVRNAFTAFSRGADGFEGMKSGELYNQIAIFLRKMHDRGVYFRDLSAGNLLFRFKGDKTVEFALIDTARAAFYDQSIGLRQRLCDLMRICHPLSWNGRKVFLAKYMAFTGRRYHGWMNIPFYYYDLKHWLKKQLRRRSIK